MKKYFIGLTLFILLTPFYPAYAHVGSRDIFERVNTGGYKLYVTIRPPTVIPGVAIVEVHSSGKQVERIAITPMPMGGEGSIHAPRPDMMIQSTADSNDYTGSLWLMSAGSWRVHLNVDGKDGAQSVFVPVPALNLFTLKLQGPLRLLLIALGLLLAVGLASIIASAVRESTLVPGLSADTPRRQRSRAVFVLCLAGIFVMLWEGNRWWSAEAAIHQAETYTPLHASVSTQANRLTLQVKGDRSSKTFYPRARASGSNDEFIPDHGHFMHLYAVRMPQMDAVYHLHPSLSDATVFRQALPAMPPGTYALYGDIVHANGLSETILSDVVIGAGATGGLPVGDDAGILTQPMSNGILGDHYALPDGYMMTWSRPSALKAGAAYTFHFALLDNQGHAAVDMQPYMGMQGHAAFIKSDGTVFAHIHPDGSASMAALQLANSSPQSSVTANDMHGMQMNTGSALSNQVEFPYGFPSPGRYRIIVQMKHGDTVETGAFDAQVEPAS
jgi:hypothetical protein